MGGWLLVVVFFRDMVFKDRAGSDMCTIEAQPAQFKLPKTKAQANT